MYINSLKDKKCVIRCMKDNQLGYKYTSSGECFIGKNAYKEAEKEMKKDNRDEPDD